MENFNIEEIKTAIGHLMKDLRGDWNDFGGGYTFRLNELIKLLNLLIEKDKFNHEIYKNDLFVAMEEKDSNEEDYDGRVFRDWCKLYSYSNKEGRTEQVKEYLEEILSHPEFNQIDLEEV